MDSKKHDATDSAANPKDAKEHTDHAGEPVIESVARGIGTAIGVVASTAAKVMGKAESPEHETRPHETKSPETKAKEKPRKSSKPRPAANEGTTKLSANRAAKKKKKRAAHRIKLKRSNTKG